MKPFTKNELIGTVVILTIIGFITFKNILVAERRARDSQRQADISAVADALQAFFDDYGYFPPSEDGYIKACKSEKFAAILEEVKRLKEFDRNKYFEGLTKCVWGKDAFTDLLDEAYTLYLRAIPKDPREDSGLRYFYISNQNRYQIYTALEGKSDEDTYNSGIVSRNLACGNEICSFGKSYGETPLDKSIEEYEQELIELQKKQK